MAKKDKDFLEIIAEKFGEQIMDSPDVRKVVSTGSLSLDVSTGVGGLPRGRLVEIFGPESAGKTSIGLSVAKSAIASGEKVLYLDIEQTLDDALVRAILEEHYSGEKFVVIRPETAEMAFTVAEQAIENGDFAVIIFDSLGAVSPEKELEDDFGDANVALIARLNTSFLRRNAFSIRKKDILFIFINQVRDNIGGWIKSFSTPGGHAVKHYSSMRISLYPGKVIKVGKDGEYLKQNDGDKEARKVGTNVNFTIVKNKVGVPYREATLPLIWGHGVDYIKDVLDFASMLGVVASRGPYKVFNEETIALGDNKTLEKLREDTALLDKIVEACYNTAGVKPIKEEKDE